MEPVIVLTAGEAVAGGTIESRVQVPCSRALSVCVFFNGKPAPPGSSDWECVNGQMTIRTTAPKRGTRVQLKVKRSGQTLALLRPRVL